MAYSVVIHAVHNSGCSGYDSATDNDERLDNNEQSDNAGYWRD